MGRLLIRSAGAILLGLAIAMGLIIVTEVISSFVHPFPPGVDPTDMEVCKAHVARSPSWVLAFGAVLWGGTAFLSSWIATRLGAGRHPFHGIAIGILLIGAAAFNIYLLPYPIWFEIIGLLALAVGVAFGAGLGRDKAPSRPS